MNACTARHLVPLLCLFVYHGVSMRSIGYRCDVISGVGKFLFVVPHIVILLGVFRSLVGEF